MPGYFIDHQTLREVLTDQQETRSRVAQLAATGEDGDAERIGWLRMLGELSQAELVARAATKREPTIRARLRLAHVLHWQQNFTEADEIFTAVLEEIYSCEPNDFSRLDAGFAHQHFGKSLFDQGQLTAAHQQFELALHHRIAAGASSDVLESSRQALRVCREQMAEAGKSQ